MLPDSRLGRDLFADLDRIFRRLDAPTRGLDGRHGLVHASRPLLPRFEVTEDDAQVVLLADVPGLRADALTVTLDGDALTLKGRVGDDAAADEAGWTRVHGERRAWSFERTFRFQRPVDGERLTASLTDGVLRVVAPKRAPTTLTIPVQGA